MTSQLCNQIKMIWHFTNQAFVLEPGLVESLSNVTSTVGRLCSMYVSFRNRFIIHSNGKVCSIEHFWIQHHQRRGRRCRVRFWIESENLYLVPSFFMIHMIESAGFDERTFIVCTLLCLFDARWFWKIVEFWCCLVIPHLEINPRPTWRGQRAT